MKIVILCALFTPIIYLALKQKKWYLYLLFAFIGILPEQFSVRVHDSIPLLSATRALIIVVMGFWLYDKWKTKQFRFPKSILLFLAVNVIISLINLRYGSDDIKRIFLLVFERVLLVIVLVDMIHDREEFNRCIDFAIMGCAALAVIGIVQTVFGYDISSALHLLETFTSVQLSERMGLTRAFGTYNAISYGCYGAFMTMLILYRLYNTKNIWHSVAFALNFVALVCTFTRSAWLCLAAVIFVVLLMYRTKLIRRLLPSGAIALVLLVIVCCIQPKLYGAFVETGKSSINTVLGVIPDSVVAIFTPKETEPAATVQTEPAATVQTEPATTAQTEPAATVQTEPAATVQTEPAATVQTEPAATVQTEPAATVQTEPAATVQTEPAATVQTEPAATVQTEPAATVQTEPAATVQTEPAATEEPKPVQRPGFQLDENFGLNANNPAYSRTAQWTAVEYMAKEGQLLFGYGYNAFPRGKIHVFYDQWAAKWEPAITLDVGGVALFTECGLIGAIAYLGLLGYMLVCAFLKRSREDKFDFYRLVIFVIPLYLLLNYLAAFLDASIVWLFFGLFYAYKNLDKKEQLQ